MKTLLVIAALACATALGCEHPAENDDTADSRYGVDGRWTSDPRLRERPRTGGDRDQYAMPMPGPRTNTPGGVAAGIHGEREADEQARPPSGA